jgi:hypothetical protein
MELEVYEFRDPGRLIREIARRVTLQDDSAWLVQVAHPSTEQRIVRVDELITPAVIDDWQEARDEMYDVIRGWHIPNTGRPSHAAMLVVVRRGLCISGPNEKFWHLA